MSHAPQGGQAPYQANSGRQTGCEFDEHECVQPPEQHGVAVLPRQPQDQRTEPDTSAGRGPAGPPMRIRPPAREHRPVPTTNRLRPHEHAAPPVTRKHPGQCGQEHPIGWAAAWPAHLPTEHRELVTQNEYLDLVRGV